VLKSACMRLNFPNCFALGRWASWWGFQPKRFANMWSVLNNPRRHGEASVAEGNRSKLERTMKDCLQDAPRSGRPPDFSPLQIVSTISIACEKPEASGRPISKWTSREIAEEALGG